jgi:hypothetical protein
MKRMALIALALACGKSHATATGSTGAFGIVTVDGKQKMYLPLIDQTGGPQGVARLAVVDVGLKGNGTAGAPAQIGIVSLGAGALVAVADLSRDISLVAGEVPSPPGSAAAWRNMGDPHGLAVTTGIATGKPVGFVVNAE